MDTVFTVVAILFVSLYTLKMIGWLIGSQRITKRIHTLYESRIKKIGYLVIFPAGSLLLLTRLNMAEYVVAVLTIGALYDYFFAKFPTESGALVKASMEDKKRMWFFGITFSIVLTVALVLYLIVR